jgi:predicted phosphoadenosine phosphosulfate sulfurtransferase
MTTKPGDAAHRRVATRFYLTENVFEAALARVRWLYDEFDYVCVSSSGGKDSTVCLNLALQVAEERGRLPVPLIFVDQEAEWEATIDHVRLIMADPRVEPIWLQVPIRLFNATSTRDPWLYCWEEGREWIRPKEPGSVHENVFGTDRFKGMFDGSLRHYADKAGAKQGVMIGGVRTEESPARARGLTTSATYKSETWGRRADPARGLYSMYPIYDWSYTDVWHAIETNHWPYCRLYDYMYQYGIPPLKMRVSNVHHETAVQALFFLQEIEAETWNRITARLHGINSAGQLQQEFLTPKELPPMFKDWFEYRDHLLENLIESEETRTYFRNTFAKYDGRYMDEALPYLAKTEIGMILNNDYHDTKLGVFRARFPHLSKNRGRLGGNYDNIEKAEAAGEIADAS